MKTIRYQLDSGSICLSDKAYDAYRSIIPLLIIEDPSRRAARFSLRGAFQIDHMTESDVNGILEELYDLFLRREDEENEN